MEWLFPFLVLWCLWFSLITRRLSISLIVETVSLSLSMVAFFMMLTSVSNFPWLINSFCHQLWCLLLYLWSWWLSTESFFFTPVAMSVSMVMASVLNFLDWIFLFFTDCDGCFLTCECGDYLSVRSFSFSLQWLCLSVWEWLLCQTSSGWFSLPPFVLSVALSVHIFAFHPSNSLYVDFHLRYDGYASCLSTRRLSLPLYA